MLEVVNSIKLYVVENYPLPEGIADDWADSVKRKGPRTFAKIKDIIATPQDYMDKIADPAAFAYRNVINPAFVSKSGRTAQKIRNAQRANIMRAYGKFQTKLEHAFETVDEEQTKRYNEKVDQSKDTFSEGMADRTMRFTGDRVTGLGIAPRAGKWLSGENIRVRSEYDYVAGTPVNIAIAGLKSQLKSALVPRLVQSGIAIVHSQMDSTIIADENTLINQLLSALRDSTVYEEFVQPWAALKSHCGYIVEDGQLYLRIQVVKL